MCVLSSRFPVELYLCGASVRGFDVHWDLGGEWIDQQSSHTLSHHSPTPLLSPIVRTLPSSNRPCDKNGKSDPYVALSVHPRLALMHNDKDKTLKKLKTSTK